MTFIYEEKTTGAPLKSQDWNVAMQEIERLGKETVKLSGDSMTGDLSIAKALVVNGKTTVKAGLAVTGDLTTADKIIAIGPLEVSGKITTKGGLDVSAGDLSISNNIIINGNIQNNSVGVKGDLCISSVVSGRWLRISAKNSSIGFFTADTAPADNGTNASMIVKESGFVGIGTTSPTEKLEVSGGNLKVSGSLSAATATLSGALTTTGKLTAGELVVTGVVTANAGLNVTGTITGTKLTIEQDIELSGNIKLKNNKEIVFEDNGKIRSADNLHQIAFDRTNDKLQFTEFGEIQFLTGASPTKKLVVTQGGNIGINVDSPSAKLEINGNLKLTRTDTTGGKYLFLELYQAAGAGDVSPCVRFHQSGIFYYRLEVNKDGFHFKEGDLTKDAYTNIYAANATLDKIDFRTGESLRIIRGIVDANGSILSGTGFTVTSPGEGRYRITFNASFSTYPTIIVTQQSANTTGVWNTRDNCLVLDVQAAYTEVACGDGSGVYAYRKFHFIAIGS